jgi:hypothetical protein
MRFFFCSSVYLMMCFVMVRDETRLQTSFRLCTIYVWVVASLYKVLDLIASQLLSFSKHFLCLDVRPSSNLICCSCRRLSRYVDPPALLRGFTTQKFRNVRPVALCLYRTSCLAIRLGKRSNICNQQFRRSALAAL